MMMLEDRNDRLNSLHNYSEKFLPHLTSSSQQRKVLDSVWQYIKTSPDKEDLCKILKNEMTENIGMCAQGNLSRICNILAGYLDGVGEQECLSERLGRLLSSVMSIESIIERVEKACNILKENNVPMDEWEFWMDPVLEDNSVEIYENVKQTLAGTSNPVLVLTTGVVPNAINAGVAPLEIAIRLDVIAVLVLTAPAVKVTV
jgi:hypothetical protein